jgi:hypothetical protein
MFGIPHSRIKKSEQFLFGQVQLLRYPQPNLTPTLHKCMEAGIGMETGFIGPAKLRKVLENCLP